jgi:hypothetical protein
VKLHAAEVVLNAMSEVSKINVGRLITGIIYFSSNTELTVCLKQEDNARNV